MGGWVVGGEIWEDWARIIEWFSSTSSKKLFKSEGEMRNRVFEINKSKFMSNKNNWPNIEGMIY